MYFPPPGQTTCGASLPSHSSSYCPAALVVCKPRKDYKAHIYRIRFILETCFSPSEVLGDVAVLLLGDSIPQVGP